MVSLKIGIVFSLFIGLHFGDSSDHTLIKYVRYSEIGGAVLLPCVKKLDKEYKNTNCKWTSSDSAGESDVVIAANSSTPSPDPRFKIVGEWWNGNCSLQLSSIKEEDMKTYSCRVYPSNHHVSIVQILLGATPEFPKIFYGEEDVTFKEHVEAVNGKDIKLKCVVKNGVPSPTITWVGFESDKFTNTSQVAEASSVLLLTSNDVPNDGERPVVCRAVHPLYPGFVATVNVSIGYPYAIKEVKILPLKVSLGQVITCDAVGIPGPDKYIWKRKEGQDWKEISSWDSKSNTFIPTKEGKYKCLARNYLNTHGILESEEVTVEGKGNNAAKVDFPIILMISTTCFLAIVLNKL